MSSRDMIFTGCPKEKTREVAQAVSHAGASHESGYDRASQVLEFDETKAGAKGLSDYGMVEIPGSSSIHQRTGGSRHLKIPAPLKFGFQ
ncbi:hypothetical protein Ancab_022425 [Ancistrocladus abbreviatus]